MLENLSLRTDALAGLVPAHLHSGRIGRLEMVVPWHKLGSLPVTLDLRDVSVLCSPLNEHAWQPEEEEARQWSKKQAALRTRGAELTRELLEKLQGSLTPERDDGSLSPGLLARVLDNVQLTVTNVHVRYEDRTNSSTPFALGLRLDTVQIKALDEQGRTRFVERLPGKPVRKSVAVRELSLYLDTGLAIGDLQNHAAAADSTFNRRPDHLFTDDVTEAASYSPSSDGAPFLLRPLSGRVLLVFDQSPHRPPGVPAAMVQLDFGVAALCISHAQYMCINDLLHYARYHSMYLSRLRHASHRPKSSPLEDPREWWRFAARAAFQELGAFAIVRMDATFIRHRREYISAYQVCAQ